MRAFEVCEAIVFGLDGLDLECGGRRHILCPFLLGLVTMAIGRRPSLFLMENGGQWWVKGCWEWRFASDLHMPQWIRWTLKIERYCWSI